MINARPGQHWHFVGDSITQQGWFVPLVALINAAIAALPPRQFSGRNVGPSRGQNSVGAGNGRTQTVAPAPITTTSSGVVGNVAADIAADVPGRIIAFNPDVVVLEVGVNDAIANTPGPAFSLSYVSILDQTIAWRASVPIGCVNILCYGEQWRAVNGPWGPNVDDAFIADLNVRINAAAVTRAQTTMDIRTPAGVFETLNNLPQPGAVSGVLTVDAVHPNATGKTQMGNWTFPSVDVTP